ncbi:MAG: hypothetical protein HOE90_08910 [Bacteriovoracaceae bacterium]|jgi:shikimate kinase|nr:hypothetical protein [Bacteriovoracaceae bacterium]
MNHISTYKALFCLCGFMASGKSQLGLRLARDFNDLVYLDTDQVLEDNVLGCSIPEFVRKNGMDGFRKLEGELLTELTAKRDHIISLGGGSLNAENIVHITGAAHLIWVNTPFSTCLDRIRQDQQTRPLSALSDDDLQKLYLERVVFYSQAEFQIADPDSEYNFLHSFISDRINI